MLLIGEYYRVTRPGARVRSAEGEQELCLGEGLRFLGRKAVTGEIPVWAFFGPRGTEEYLTIRRGQPDESYLELCSPA